MCSSVPVKYSTMVPNARRTRDDASSNEAATATPSDSSEHGRPPNAFGTASFLSKLLFTWPYPLLQLGMRKTLQDSDLPESLPADSSAYALPYFTRLWQREQQRERPSLRRAIAMDFWSSVWYAQPLMAAGAAAKVTQAVALGQLIKFFQGEQEKGYQWATILVGCGIVILFEHHHLFFFTWRKGMQIRIACIAAIYDKCTRLPSVSDSSSSSYGHVMNLVSNDVERFLMAALFINYIFWGPILFIAILIVGYLLMGWSFCAGLALLILVFIPLQLYLSYMFAHYRSTVAALTDRRVSFVAEAIRGVRVMKMSAFELLFLDRIMHYRKDEVSKIAQANTLKAWNEALIFATNVVVSLAIFTVHVLLGNTLNQGDVFTVFSLINILQMELTKHVSLAIMATSEVYVSIGRIQRFLEAPELETPCEALDDSKSVETVNKDIAVELLNVNCYWSENIPTATQTSSESDMGNSQAEMSVAPSQALRDISVCFHWGKLTAVIGIVGSGKSALLQALVQELPIASGAMIRHRWNDRPATIAYAAQDPWIMDGTVRENVLMGQTYDVDWYNEVISACALVIDLQQFPHGDATILGDRGVQCSGGQRARIGLARAIYRQADILVLDDPLSAVDTKVGRQLYQEAILRLNVDRGKCVLLATHQHQYVQEWTCLFMSHGTVRCIGTYDECVGASNGKLTQHTAIKDSVTETTTSMAMDVDIADEAYTLPPDNTMELDTIAPADHQEMNQKGSISSSTYKCYLVAMGGLWIGVIVLLLFSVTQGSVLVTIILVGRWSARTDQRDAIGVIWAWGSAVVVLAVIRARVCFRLAIRASRQLHDQMAQAMIRAPIAFFDTNPLGRILNRFSADVGILDDQLPPTLFDFWTLSFVVLGAVATTIATLPFVLIALPFIGAYFWSVRRVFVTSTRELKRLEGLARSPIYAMMSECLQGIATIRSNGAVLYFRNKFQQVHDRHTRSFFAFIAASRWVGFRMDALVFFLLAIASYGSVLFHEQGWFNVDPAILGLSLSMLLQLAGLFQWCVRQSAEVVNQMVSVERVVDFGQIAGEAPLELEGDSALKDWPSRGEIHVEKVSVRYRPTLPYSLESVDLIIPAGSRVGIVGRSGSGKSTLMQTLFRLLEVAEGRILLDGVDISKIGLHTLRTKLSVLPQVPTWFSGGTIRENLDFFREHDDKDISIVLKSCHLAEVIDGLPAGLDTKDGSFSQGQRQLLCLARALLRQNRILILDEATAHVDPHTDHLLQATLQQIHSTPTVIAIAHRLDTIIDYDLVAVLGNGCVLEYGPPAELLRSCGPFASMVADTGDLMAQELIYRANAKDKKIL
jgi:ATP-binding cassette, subfamily C (CFTR/MRP), member 4